jgi:hypothetical protein
LCREIGKSKMPAAILLKRSLLQQWEKNQCKEKEEWESSPHQPHHQPEPTKNQQDINVAQMQQFTMCSRDTWNVSQFAVAFVYSLVVGAKLTLASCIHLHSLTFDSQSRVCNSCVFSQFSHLGDRKTLILTIKKTRKRTFK